MNWFIYALIFCVVVGVTMAQEKPVATDASYYVRTLPATYKTEARDDHNQVVYQYVTADNQVFTRREYLKLAPDGSDYIPVVEGKYEYNAPDGQRIVTIYLADEYGFRASGPHIPAPLAVEAQPAPPAPPPPANAQPTDPQRAFRF